MKKIIAFGGSTSSTSINKQLAEYASSLLEEVEIEILDMRNYTTVLFSVDEEKNGYPEIMQELQKKFQSVDGFIISLAEHNGSYASAYKNTIDWLSRIERKVFNDKPILLMATSPGARGGASVLDDAKAYYPKLGADIVSTFSLGNFHDEFQEAKIVDPTLNDHLKKAVKVFQNHI